MECVNVSEGRRNVQIRIDNETTDVCRSVDFIFCVLLGVQYLVIAIIAQFVSPSTWIGSSEYVHVHVGMAIVFGALLSGFPILLVISSPGAQLNRYVIAVSQMLSSALLIHITGGRIESHFHVFGSLAFLSLYREWQVLAVATAVVAADHAMRGIWWPMSIFGDEQISSLRWLEHAVYVVFEDIVLIIGCKYWRRDMREKAEQSELLVQVCSEATRLAEQEASSAQELAQSALREMDTMREALEKHSILSVADRSGRIIDMNSGFVRISGYSREEILGRDHRILNSGKHPQEFWKDVWRQIASGSAWRGEVCNRRKDGSLYWVDSTIVPYIGRNGKVEKYVSIRFDITAQKIAENELKIAQAKASEANVAKSEFLANMSHEIRTPMTAILGFTDLLASEVKADSDSQAAEYVSIIRRNGEQLLEIINDILDISKIEAGKMAVESIPVDPLQLIHDVLSLMRVKAAAKGLVLEASFETPLPAPIHSDPVRMRQILLNLIGNAIKFTERGKVRLLVSFDRVRNCLQIAVQDSGIGITPGQLKHLFEAFHQADQSTTRRFGGSGLGLRISKRLAHMLGGEISVESQYGKGSTFTFEAFAGDISNSMWSGPLPGGGIVTHTADSASKAADHTASCTALPLLGLRILLAEDGPDNQRLISLILRKAGAEVVVAENGKLAVEALTENADVHGPLLVPDPFDLLLCDMQMPVMDGYAATQLIREKGARMPIVALTAHAMTGEREKCMLAGCDAFATKPIDKKDLIELCRIHARLDGSSQAERNVALESGVRSPLYSAAAVTGVPFTAGSSVEHI